MSIVAYYCRLSNEQLETCRNNPEILRGYSVANLSGAELMDLDQSWIAIAWLLSPRKRAEQHNHALNLQTMLASDEKPRLWSRIKNRVTGTPADGRKLRVQESIRRIRELPEDLLLVAIEGRFETIDTGFGLGLDGVSVIQPPRVAELWDALSRIGPEDLGRQFEPKLMDQQYVFPQHWCEEDNDDFESFVIPNFAKLKRFYSDASNEKQSIIVWFT